MKTYVITLSRNFPAKHPRHGEPTNFDIQTANAFLKMNKKGIFFPKYGMKLHTIRGNYELWSKRFEQINAGKACLSLRYWTGKPYHSKQTEIVKLTKEDGIGLQKAYIERLQYIGRNDMKLSLRVVRGYWQTEDPIVDGETMAKNDGLSSLRDWMPFFNGHNISKPLAIIHFTKFRY